MSNSNAIFFFLLLGSIFTGVLYVSFGQITVRKLRKNPEAKAALGFELVSGWDIVNVAEALSIPRSWMKKIENGFLSKMYAKTDFLIENTTKFDRILAVMFYVNFIFFGLSMAIFILLDAFGLLG